MRVGTLTTDEIAYAGGIIGETNSDYYLINNYQKNKQLWFWSLSPASFENVEDRAFAVRYNGYIDSMSVSMNSAIRPAIILQSNIEITGGNGTKNNPYIIS